MGAKIFGWAVSQSRISYNDSKQYLREKIMSTTSWGFEATHTHTLQWA